MRRGFEICALALLAVATIMSQTIALAGDLIEKRIDAIFAPLASPGAPGFVVLVKKNGKTVFQRGYGVRDLRTKAAIDPHTNFRLASVSKQFTAMAIMLLVHDGKLRYDSTLTGIFPAFPVYGKNITVRDLLNHTSGLLDYEDLMEAAEKQKASPIWSASNQIQDHEVLALLENQKAGKFTPGTRWEYSNSGYVVLGLIVAKVSGKSYPEFLRERMFKPLRMDHALAYVKGKSEISNRAYGHSKDGENFSETDQSSTSATLGDGGIYSNLEDLSKWDDALANHSLLSESEMELALTPVKISSGAATTLPGDTPESMRDKPVSYGFGWFLDPYQGHPRMWHYGDTMGFKSAIQRFPADKLTIIVLCNRTDLDPGSLATQVADLFLEKAH